jgi:hypothetical protein
MYDNNDHEDKLGYALGILATAVVAAITVARCIILLAGG